jgi:hypothetical protein
MSRWIKRVSTRTISISLISARAAAAQAAAEPFPETRRPRRLAVSAAGPDQVQQPGSPGQTHSAPEDSVMPASAHPRRINPSRIVIADHDRLIVTRNRVDDTICVLRPPGQDPADILRVARLVLPEGAYGALAEHLGVSPSSPKD